VDVAIACARRHGSARPRIEPGGRSRRHGAISLSAKALDACAWTDAIKGVNAAP
jgi:hypothetical protein